MSEMLRSQWAGVLPCRAAEIVPRPLGTRLVLYHPGSREVSVLNATAAAVWAMCDGRTPLRAAAARIRERFRVPEEQDVEEDIAAVVRTLTERGLLCASPTAEWGRGPHEVPQLHRVGCSTKTGEEPQ